MVLLGGTAKVWPGLVALWASSRKRCLRHIAMPWLCPRAKVAREGKVGGVVEVGVGERRLAGGGVR
jgi:hypothetical protein